MRSSDPAATPRLVGAPLQRKEGRRLPTRSGRYAGDLRGAGPAARRALRLRGVLAVLTVADAPELAGSIPPLIREPGWPAYRHPLLAAERVRHVGEAVAVVVAEEACPAVDGAHP